MNVDDSGSTKSQIKESSNEQDDMEDDEGGGDDVVLILKRWKEREKKDKIDFRDSG